MKEQREKLYDAITQLDASYIQDAEAYTPKKRRPLWLKISAAAACLVLLCGIVAGGRFIALQADNTSALLSTVSASGDVDAEHEEGENYDRYAGPVLPLTLLDAEDGITAQRTVTFDFALNTTLADLGYYVPQDNVEDCYVLTNETDEALTITALYPFIGTFSDETIPTLTIDGERAETTLYSGACCGAFLASIGGDATETPNLNSPSSWSEYQALLEDGSYLRAALDGYTALEESVVVYVFTDAEINGNDTGIAPTLDVEYTIDVDKTTVLSYNFTGAAYDDESGSCHRSFFIQSGGDRTYYLIVIGDDLDGYTIQGYRDGGCDEGEEIDGVTANVTRYETTLGEIMYEITQDYYNELLACNDEVADHNVINSEISLEMYYCEVCRLYAEYGPGSDNPTDRLDSLLGEICGQQRIMYQSFSVTIPAGESVVISIAQYKASSCDYTYSADSGDVHGYDLTTQIGSNLNFTAQYVALANTDTIEIVSQNFGFDTVNGITFVALSLLEEHYYLNIRYNLS